MKKNLQDNVWKYYLYNISRSLIFSVPVFVLFLQSNGLSLSEVMLLESLFALGVFIFQVPTGVFADKFGRRFSIIIGSVLYVSGYFFYGVGTNFFGFVAAELLLAIGSSFVAGADSAMIYDSLKQVKRENDFKKIWGNAKSIYYAGCLVTALTGGIIAATISLRATMWGAFFGLMPSILIALWFEEPKHFKKVGKPKYLEHTIESFKKAFTDKNILFLVLFYAMTSAVGKIGFWFYQPYLKGAGYEVAIFGFIFATFNIVAILASKYAHKLDEFFGIKNSLWIIIITSTLSLILMGVWEAMFGLIFLYFANLQRGLQDPILQHYTNQKIPSEKRATLLSIQQMCAAVVFAVMAPVYGYIADVLSLNWALIITGSSFFIAFILLMLWKKRV